MKKPLNMDPLNVRLYFTGNLVKIFQRLAIDIPPDSSDQSDPFEWHYFLATPLPEEMMLIEYYCPSCQAHGYKFPTRMIWIFGQI